MFKALPLNVTYIPTMIW